MNEVIAGAYPDNDAYAYDGGTSMAAPLVAGCAALVRQYFIDVRNHRPSAALLKATLINSTTRLTGTDAIAPADGEPNYHQGHGLVNITKAIPSSANPAFAIEFFDNWEDAASQFTRTGDVKTFRFSLEPGTLELRVCLAYTDRPGRGQQNNLNLVLRHSPSGTKWIGNEQLPDSLKLPDPDNNVEAVRVDTPPPGTYFVQVLVANLLQGPQDFALVVGGVGVSGLSPA